MVSFCELCGAEADFHCAADSAFLCRSCDAKLHASNFLFARHFRRVICPYCKSLTRDFISGPLLPAWPPRTTCCSGSSSSCCSSLECVSSSELSSTTRGVNRGQAAGGKKKVEAKAVVVVTVADGIFVTWCNKLGLNRDLTNAVVSYASLALAVVERRPRSRAMKRVILAAAFWFGVKNTMTWQSLKKVEAVTGVAAGMIRAVESKLARAMKLQLRRRRVDSEEGWAENDNV